MLMTYISSKHGNITSTKSTKGQFGLHITHFMYNQRTAVGLYQLHLLNAKRRLTELHIMNMPITDDKWWAGRTTGLI